MSYTHRFLYVSCDLCGRKIIADDGKPFLTGEVLWAKKARRREIVDGNADAAGWAFVQGEAQARFHACPGCKGKERFTRMAAATAADGGQP